MECGQGRPIVSNINTYNLTYNGGTLRIDAQANGGGWIKLWDLSGVTDQQHSSSATFSAPTTQGDERSWMTVSTDGKIIGGGFHGTTNESYVQCGVALNGLERVPEIAASYPAVTMRCHNALQQDHGTFSYSTFSMENRVVTGQSMFSPNSRVWGNFNEDYVSRIFDDQISYSQSEGQNPITFIRDLMVDLANQNIVGTVEAGRQTASTYTCGDLRLGSWLDGSELISKSINPDLVAQSSAEMQCDRNGAKFTAQVALSPQALVIQVPGEPTIELPMSVASDLPMTARSGPGGELMNYRYRDRTTWYSTQLGSQLLEAAVIKADFGQVNTLKCQAN